MTPVPPAGSLSIKGEAQFAVGADPCASRSTTPSRLGICVADLASVTETLADAAREFARHGHELFPRSLRYSSPIIRSAVL
jgi:hypothetical protein